MFPVNLYEVKEYEADMQGFVTSHIVEASNVKILIPCVNMTLVYPLTAAECL